MPEAFVAAGSNVEPRANLRRAVAALAARFPGLRQSRAWSNPPVGFRGSDFINLVVAFPCELPAEELLAALKALEQASGRERDAPKWGPRTLDLDLLLYGKLTGTVAGATLPHPDLLKRAFVLGPLAELAPGLLHPELGVTIDGLWRRFDRGAHPMRETSLDGADA